MLNVKRIKKIIIMTMILLCSLLILSTTSLANDFNMALSGSTNVIGVTNNVSSFVRSNAPIYFEDLARTSGLICNGHGVPLPSRLSYSQPLKDATLDTSGINVVIDQLTEANKIQRNPAYSYTQNQPDATNPYGTTGSVVTTTRTQALYNNNGLKDLSYREAYVLSHEKDTSQYPDAVQLAYWGVTQYNPGGSLSNENVNISPETRERAKNLVNEAIKYEETMLAIEEFKKNNNGKIIVDKTNYSDVHPGYNKTTGKIIVGPFQWDYVRGYYKPSELGQSKTVNKDGVVSYSGITGVKWYADKEKTIEIKNVTLIYGERNLGKGDEKYAFPYPNEPFYIEFSKAENPNVKNVAKSSIDFDIMNANGQAYDINGTFNDVNWIARDREIKCTCATGVCSHGMTNHQIPHTSYSFWGGTSVYYTVCPVVYCQQHPTKRLGDGHLQGHDFYIEGEIVNPRTGQPQKVVQKCTILMDNNCGDIDLGEPVILPVLIPVVLEREKEIIIVPQLPEEPVDPNDPPYVPPVEPEEIVLDGIPLIFEIAGEVWVDNPTGKEALANGIRDTHELGKANVEVYLYNVKNPLNAVAKTITNSDGKYSFGTVEIGEEYFVEFVYDGMTYKTTKYLNTGFTESMVGEAGISNSSYIKNPENYLKSSHAIENTLERDLFNDKFYEISNNVASSKPDKDGKSSKISLDYYTVTSSQGTMSSLITTDSTYMTLPEFKMSARTSNTGLVLPLDNAYYVDTKNLNLPNQNGQEYKYVRTYEGLKHINLGLVKREQGDFAVKNDTYQTTITYKGQSPSFEHNTKITSALTYDANKRTVAYYTNKTYTQLLNKEDYAWRHDTSYGENAEISKTVYDVSDEMNVYIEYKFLLRNQSTLEWGRITELTNYFDPELIYSEEYYHTDMTSWIEVKMNGSKEVTKQEITWKYGQDKDGYKSIYTDDLKDIKLVSGETLEVHLILQVSKDEARNIILNNNDNPDYRNVLEITKFSVNEGLVDRDSNPGSANLKDTTTYEDDTDNAPFVSIKLDESEAAKLGNIISGNVFEDLKTKDLVLENNMFTGNGIKDNNEKGIANVKVELIEVLMNKDSGKEVELIVRDAIRTDKDGNYSFTNLHAGTYKVKFTYGDKYQLEKDVTYNGQDYKSVSTDTLKQQYQNNPMEVMILIDTSEGMKHNDRLDTIKNSSKQLISSIYSKVQTAKIGLAFFSEPKSDKVDSTDLVQRPNVEKLIKELDKEKIDKGANLADTIRKALTIYSNNTNIPKVMIILTDGYMEDVKDDKEMIEEAKKQGVKVISVVASMDEWSEDVFGNEYKSVPNELYSISDEYLTEYITEVVLESTLFELEKTLPNLTDAKDVQKEYIAPANSKVGDIHTREQNMAYTEVMVNQNGQIVDGADSSDLTEFANKTQMTAITPVRVVALYHDNSRTANTNLGLIERPKVELQIKEEVESYKVTLADGRVIIDSTKTGMTQNVLDLNDKTVIHLDDEIMQGATLTIKYKIKVVNNGQVDTLGEYFDYNMFDTAEVAKYTATVPTMIGTLYSYYDNLVFRTEDNNRMPIEVNNVILGGLKISNGKLTNPEKLIKDGKVFNPDKIEIVNKSNTNGKVEVLNTALSWEQKNEIGTAADVDDKLKKSILQVVSTNTLKDLELYPTISKEVLSNEHYASLTTYVQFSKVLSANDSTDTLSYNTSVEIVERLNDLGRRDYVGVPGNYLSFDEITEYDSAKAKNVTVLNPFGLANDNTVYIALIAGCVLILGAGIIFIKRKVL